jgi:DNA-binding PadR family transcriptional regulator
VKSLNRIGMVPASVPLAADDVVEFHAARLLLLLSLCGIFGRIDGLTKLAKLDFFARYPEFFAAARAATETQVAKNQAPVSVASGEAVESAMVRHHYGPWDKRYYHVLAHLEAKGLIVVSKEGRAYRIVLTDPGRERAKALAERPSFQPLAARMRELKKAFGGRTGTSLKNLVYQLFDEEVRRRPLGQVIRR